MHILRKLWAKVTRPGWRWALLFSLICGIGLDVALIRREKVAFEWASSVELILIALSAPIGVIVAHLSAQDRPPDLPSGEQFLLARAAELWGEDLAIEDKRGAILELTPKLAKPLGELDYLERVLPMIEASSVWAVCGRKSDPLVDQFWEANIKSKENGHHVERVFFPPEDQREVTAITTAITKHLAARIVVRAFKRFADELVRNTVRPPKGFGMTLMRKSDPDDPLPKDPLGEHSEVLIHWGGLDRADRHFGVILSDPAWIQHFWTLFTKIRPLAPVANVDNDATEPREMTIDEFFDLHPHYKKPRRK